MLLWMAEWKPTVLQTWLGYQQGSLLEVLSFLEPQCLLLLCKLDSVVFDSPDFTSRGLRILPPSFIP